METLPKVYRIPITFQVPSSEATTHIEITLPNNQQTITCSEIKKFVDDAGYFYNQLSYQPQGAATFNLKKITNENIQAIKIDSINYIYCKGTVQLLC